MTEFDNADYSEKSSLAGSKNYASAMLFQDASEKPLGKPPVYSTNACCQVTSTAQLPCQVVTESHLLVVFHLLTCFFHENIALLNILILTQLEKSS